MIINDNNVIIYDLRSTKSFCGGSDWRTTVFSPVLCELQGTFNCVILVSAVGGIGNPRRKWEEMGERERKREREGEIESVEKCCFFCKMI